MGLATRGPTDDNQAARLQGSQAVAHIAFIASQRLDEFIMAQNRPTLGPSIFRHQALEDLALQPG